MSNMFLNSNKCQHPSEISPKFCSRSNWCHNKSEKVEKNNLRPKQPNNIVYLVIHVLQLVAYFFAYRTEPEEYLVQITFSRLQNISNKQTFLVHKVDT